MMYLVAVEKSVRRRYVYIIGTIAKFALFSDRLFHAVLCLKKRISTEPETAIQAGSVFLDVCRSIR